MLPRSAAILIISTAMLIPIHFNIFFNSDLKIDSMLCVVKGLN